MAKIKEGDISFNNVTDAWNSLFSKSGNDSAKVANALGMAYSNNPYIQSERVKSVNSLPVFFKRNDLETAMKDMTHNEKKLREMGWALFSTYPMMKLYYLYTDILSYRNYLVPKYVRKEDVSRPDFDAEHKYVHRLLDKIRPKRVFRNMALETLIEGKTAYCLRLGFDEKEYAKHSKLPKIEYCSFQKIPSDYWKITGINSDSKYTVSVDFSLFWRPGYSIEQYPPIFKKYYEYFNGLVGSDGKPIGNIDKFPNNIALQYQNSTYFYWVQMPVDEIFVFSHCEAHSWQLPNFSGLFLQAQDLQSYSYLQEELLQLPLSSVIIGTLPMQNKDSKSGAIANNFALSTDAVSFFENLFNSVAPRGVKFMLAPGESYQHFKFDNAVPNNISIVTETQQQWISSSGTGGLMSTTNKPSQAMVKSAQKIEPRYSDRFYEQWMNMIDIILERKIGTKYTWKFIIEGNIFDDAETLAMCKEALTLGQTDVLPQYKSFFSEDMEDVISRQHYVDSTKIYDRFKVVESAFNSAKVATPEKNGRPAMDDSKVENDNTAASKDSGSNTSEGRVTKFMEGLSEEEMEFLKDTIQEMEE